MDFRLVTDSCCELTEDLRKVLEARDVPLSMILDNTEYVDDDMLDVPGFVADMKKYRGAPKSSCPPPAQYADAFRGALHVFVVTISSSLSGSYASAMAARDMMIKENPSSRIHVFDSQSASAGELAVCYKIKDCIAQGLDFDGIIKKVELFIRRIKTLFILENLDTLIKNGRMSRITGYVASAMSLRPIMTAEDGKIKLLEKARGSVQAFTRMADLIGEMNCDLTKRILFITHCNNERQAKFLKAEAEKRYPFREVIVMPTGGLSSMYANDGGVIMAF